MTRSNTFAAVILTLASLITCSSTLFGQRPPRRKVIRAYDAVGRIQWELPSGPDYSFAVPHFTVGPRIKCRGPHRDCEIRVASRDITVGLEARRDKLSAELDQYVERSKEKAIQIRTFGSGPQVTYATLTDSRPAAGEFRILTIGFSVTGPAVIHFNHLSNDPRDVREILDVVQRARTIDALGIWAWKLKDYQIVCEERFLEYKEVNDTAFQSSPFSSVDIRSFWQRLMPSESREVLQKMGEVSRASYAKAFDQESTSDKQAFCKSFPTWVNEAAKDVSAK